MRTVNDNFMLVGTDLLVMEVCLLLLQLFLPICTSYTLAGVCKVHSGDPGCPRTRLLRPHPHSNATATLQVFFLFADSKYVVSTRWLVKMQQWVKTM